MGEGSLVKIVGQKYVSDSSLSDEDVLTSADQTKL